ncbi:MULTISPECIES: [FeFe] hydrogenase H-cluster radical SAM maturase HydE [Paenibacillus]|uniref:[FeFe] hydrogenase H-cluster radical SAM maturase HydE n=1 Tax=Paenibacillus borealis TaxID=160799 RepID=A0ABX3HRJ4_PAEBO|nr:[FeFe] hydrogenase H-cluster radical SAM maturase HydE [Paenibacillus borealis]OMD52378.1 [FeFe] hydrogenase H-cluster radical SAM maturase HydE [Paenibacillus borealis]
MSTEQLLDRLYEEESLEAQEIITVLRNPDQNLKKRLHHLAHLKRMERYGDRVFLRGLIEFSNICKQNCLYCGIRSGNKTVSRYRLQPEEILECCREGYELGYRTFVLQSGEDDWYTTEKLAELIMRIKTLYPDTAVTLSIGERDDETYATLLAAGADRYLLRHETASRKLYQALHPTMTFDSRRNRLEALKSLGYQVGAGFMVGLPGQTPGDLAEDLLYLKALEPDMIGIGPFLPHQATPLKDEPAGTVIDTLDMIALARLFVPNALIPATTAMGTAHPNGRELALQAGANVVMPNLSPLTVRAQYTLYNNKICLGDESAQCRFCLEQRIEAAGFHVDMGRGDSLNHLSRSSAQHVPL